MLCMVFLVKKKELSIMDVQIFSDSYTYTKKEQIEEVWKNNSEVIEKLVIGMKESKQMLLFYRN